MLSIDFFLQILYNIINSSFPCFCIKHGRLLFFRRYPVKKRTLYTEAAYGLGLLLLACGTALTAYGGYGISMVAAPGYVLHLKLIPLHPFFSFGTVGYLVEALILLFMMLLIRKARFTYLLSFVTAVLYGLALDGFSPLTGLLPAHSLALQIPLYIAGALLCSAAISLLLLAYFPPAAHEMFVKEVSRSFRFPLTLLKTIYDCSFLAIAIGLSLLFFGTLRGIGIGTVVCAFLNGLLIRMFTGLWKKIFIFRDKFPLRPRFQESEEIL